MVAARASGTGLSPADLERIRDTLASGRKPKVSFTESAGQIAGQIGQVVALTDPQLSDEWLVVRFGRDELPFSPTDLSIAPRQAPGRRGGAPVPPSSREEPSLPQQAPTPAEPAKPVPAKPAASVPPPPAPAPRPAAEDRPAAGSSSTPAPRPPAAGANGAPATVGAAPRPPVSEPAGGRAAESKGVARKAAKPKPAPSLTVVLAYADGEWLVSATQGSKTLAKPYVVRPSEALKMVSMLDVAGVHEAVEEIVSAARSEAETRAQRLRAELAEVEARLAELREQP